MLLKVIFLLNINKLVRHLHMSVYTDGHVVDMAPEYSRIINDLNRMVPYENICTEGKTSNEDLGDNAIWGF